MKLLIISGLLFFFGLMPESSSPVCDSLKFKTKVTNTSNGISNGEIAISIVKGKEPYKIFLFADRKENNLLDVKIEDLKNLRSGKYILVVQDAADCTKQEELVLK